MREQKVKIYNDCNTCKFDINDRIQRGWRVVSMISIPTDKTTYEVYCKIIVVYEKEAEK